MKAKNSSVIALVFMLLMGATSFLLMSVGAQLSQRIQADQTLELSDRVVRLYFNQRLKQNDSQSVIRLRDDSTLIFQYPDYAILVYEENGQLMEQMSTDAIKISDSGQVIAPVKDLKLTFENKQLILDYHNERDEAIHLSYTVLTGVTYD